jgi:integrase
MLATWEQFDSEPGFWIKASSHTKQRKVHKVPLGPAAITLIEGIRAAREKVPRRNRGEYVFPGQICGEPLKSLFKAWKTISDLATVALWADSTDCKVASLVAGLEKGLGRRPTVSECRAAAGKVGLKLPAGLSDARVYDLRHTFASVGAGGDLSLQIIGRLLGHTQARTTQRYAHLADDPLREAATKIVAQIAGANKAKQNIVSLPKRGA